MCPALVGAPAPRPTVPTSGLHVELQAGPVQRPGGLGEALVSIVGLSSSVVVLCDVSVSPGPESAPLVPECRPWSQPG